MRGAAGGHGGLVRVGEDLAQIGLDADAAAFITGLGLEDEGGPLLAKSRVLHPAERPLLPALCRQKWDAGADLKVLFVGNDFEGKNGRLALRVFRRLARVHPQVRFTYVGTVPDADLELTQGIDFRGRLGRNEVLALLKESHVLFHPTQAESFGMVLLEAAVHGLAVVVARGPGMWHVDEVFGPGQAVLLDRETVAPHDEEEAFQGLLRGLLEDPGQAREIGLAAYRGTSERGLSLEARNRTLRSLYEQALDDPADAGLLLDELPDWPASGRLAMRSGELAAGGKVFREREKITAVNFYFGSPSQPANPNRLPPGELVLPKERLFSERSVG
jgi:hypothetical protein